MISIARTFGAPVIEPPGNAARRRSSASRPGASVADDRRDQMVHGGVVLEREQLGDAHACPARRRATRSLRIRSTIIRFSARSFALSASARPERRIVLGADPARPRALDRPRLDVRRRVDAQEPLRRRAEHARIRQLDERGERRRVARAQPAVERPRRLGERRLEPLRQVRLKDIAREDVLADARHRVEIVPRG